MNKILSQILPLIVAVLALIPPIQFYVLPPYFEYWPMLIAIFGFLGVKILFIKTNPFIKAISVLTFISCFFSSAPYISFNQYISIVACCYFYIGLTRMDSWKPMFVVLKSLLIFNSILLIMQVIGSDQLLNFGLTQTSTYGIIGQHMQMGSFSLILSICLSIIHPGFLIFPIIVGVICNSAWTIFCAFIGIVFIAKSKYIKILSVLVLILAVIICIRSGKIPQALSKDMGRIMVWERSIDLLNQRPLEGWGPGTYKYIFPALSGIRGIPWKTAHNDWVQFAFELGHILSGLMVAGWLMILKKMVSQKNKLFLVGFLVISLDMMVHFPARMIQCVPLIILFLAYYDAIAYRKATC